MRVYQFITYILFSLLLLACSKHRSSSEENVNIYMVAADSPSVQGKKFGCNEVLVKVSKSISTNDNLIEGTLNTLIAEKDTDELKNYIKGPQLLLFKVNVAGGIADIYFTGDFRINGLCDIYRIDEQINETVKQFAYLKKYNIYINNQTFASYLNVAKAGFK